MSESQRRRPNWIEMDVPPGRKPDGMELPDSQRAAKVRWNRLLPRLRQKAAEGYVIRLVIDHEVVETLGEEVMV